MSPTCRDGLWHGHHGCYCRSLQEHEDQRCSCSACSECACLHSQEPTVSERHPSRSNLRTQSAKIPPPSPCLLEPWRNAPCPTLGWSNKEMQLFSGKETAPKAWESIPILNSVQVIPCEHYVIVKSQ
ncbi:hypothetical protein BDW74DRAFT_119908 [Aspergillus multicolor]|uniref:uncharacterized protein n=1 Tax=Aspergillus multicolor TaxID=41759 RepID=UPI003CCE2806